ncbi:PDR/VanB family oxidoreductase [Pseudomonas sp. GOM7]|uniref:PDR/VanB family oxidoreductase n=1 Tax=Pseudomonas sp. GOM7 TaxID=2998079 RepID=UPI00227ADD17|nr:PDR/VanB family oxidoreductase [Pseudomonas sp. GOM7]WAJ39154.1 PDR/VanB family oxidoreductase [Pseudomonas sp. GOM7]
MIEVIIRAMRLEAEGILGLELVAADGAPLPPFEAGAHIDLHLPNGLIRQYSLCNDPAERQRYRIAVLRDAASRGGSQAVHESLRIGQRLSIGAPRNLFALDEQAPRSLLLAGGIGITPLLSMAWRLHALGADFELHQCVRSGKLAAFAERLASAPFAAHTHLHRDDGDAAQKLDLPALLAAEPAGSQLYVCGPNGFMEYVLDSARAQGWAEERLHREYFAAPEAESGGGAFTLRIASSGLELQVPEDRTALEVLEDAGFDIPVSCGQGICGTCLTRVVDGQPEHRDLFLSEEEKARNDQFTPCCSRSRSACLVVDL